MATALDALADTHDRARAVYDKLAQSRKTLDAVRVEMDTLGKLGDLVTQEDVIKGAGNLVAHGLSPMALARLLSDMPENGPAIKDWLGRVESFATQREQAVDPQLAQARHQMGVAAMRALMGHDIAQRGGGGAGRNALNASAPASPSSGGSLLPSQTLIEQAGPAGGTSAQ